MLSGEPRTGNPKSRKTKPDGATLGLLPYPTSIPRSPDASEAADERALQGCYIKQKRSSVLRCRPRSGQGLYPGPFRAVPSLRLASILD